MDRLLIQALVLCIYVTLIKIEKLIQYYSVYFVHYYYYNKCIGQVKPYKVLVVYPGSLDFYPYENAKEILLKIQNIPIAKI